MEVLLMTLLQVANDAILVLSWYSGAFSLGLKRSD